MSAPQPFSYVFITRLLVLLVIIFALAAGYYRSVLQIYHRKYVKLETKYTQLQLQENVETR